MSDVNHKLKKNKKTRWHPTYRQTTELELKKRVTKFKAKPQYALNKRINQFFQQVSK